MKPTLDIADPLLREARDLAALCRQQHVDERWSADRDFTQLVGRDIAVVNPLLA